MGSTPLTIFCHFFYEFLTISVKARRKKGAPRGAPSQKVVGKYDYCVCMPSGHCTNEPIE